jgi:8-hydroxy-5-deazaflavin:NADPH oxidoreductase
MKIAIIGAGNVGRALGTGWRKAGHEVTLGVRDPAGSRATELEQQGFAIAPPKDAAARAEVIVLAVPWVRFARRWRASARLQARS